MIHTDERFSRSVEEEVGRLEERTDAEVVVVAAERSGSYRDVAFAAASVITLCALIVLLFVPYTVHPAFAVLELVLTWLIAAWLCDARVVVRLFTTQARRMRQVTDAAAAEFHKEAVHATPRRNGVLIYVSALEGRVELLPDVGLQAKIPQGVWSAAVEEFSHADLGHFLAGMRRVGEILAEHVPPEEGQQVDLPNAPRVRP